MTHKPECQSGLYGKDDLDRLYELPCTCGASKPQESGFKHGEEGTHSICDEILKKNGGNAICCACKGHDCKPAKPQEWEELFDTRFSPEWFSGFGTTPDIDRQGIEGIKNFIRTKIEQAKKEEQERILLEGYKMIDWHGNKDNQWAGIVHANTSINAIQSLLDKVRPPMHTGNLLKD